MRNFKLKQLLKKKGIILSFLIVCSLFSCEKGLAVWNKTCCRVLCNTKENEIRIVFKFFEYNLDPAKKNSSLDNFEAFYSTDDGKSYKLLMASMTTGDQTTRTWAWIAMKFKNTGEKVDLLYYPYHKDVATTLHWLDDVYPILNVKNHSISENETWICVKWFPVEDQKNITHMKIIAKWNEHASKTNKTPILFYELNEKKAKLKSNSFNSSLDDEIKTEDKINTMPLL